MPVLQGVPQNAAEQPDNRIGTEDERRFTMDCPHLNRFMKDICVSGGRAILPSHKHSENFCRTSSHWACPMRKRPPEAVNMPSGVV